MSRALVFTMFMLTVVASPSMIAQDPASPIAGKWKVAGPPDGGEWYLVLGADSKLEVVGGGESKVKGRYTAKDGKLTVTDESGPIACLAETTATGTYKYTLEGKQLKLEVIKDECPGRRTALTSKPLEKLQ
jgi:hypothetical protein